LSAEQDHAESQSVESDASVQLSGDEDDLRSSASLAPPSPKRTEVTFKTLPTSVAGLTADQIFELERMRIQMQMRQVEINSENERRRIEIDNERRQAEMQHDLELARLNSAHVATSVQSSAGSGASNSGNGAGSQRLDLLIKLVPRFNPSDVHLFFTSFERAALLNEIPRDKWSAILHAIVFGKAQRVMSSLPITDVLDYDRVKQALLTAFDVCADVFRKRFRTVPKTLKRIFCRVCIQN
jgi:hypothetical protein